MRIRRPAARTAARCVRLVLLGSAILAVSTACSGGDMGATGELQGRTFLSVAVTDNGEPRPLVAGSQIRVTFSADTVTATAGCNTLGGAAALEDGVLVVPEPLSTTEMACEPAELMDQDRWLAELLTSRPGVTLTDESLTLRSGATVVRLADRTVVDPDRPVVGTLWRLDGLVSGAGDDGTMSSIPEGVTSTLRITDQGRLQLRPGCNTGMGSVEVAEGAGAVPEQWATSHGMLTFGPIGLTMMACPPPQMAVEQAVTAVLQGEVRYEIAGAGMRLYGTGGDPAGLVYVAED